MSLIGDVAKSDVINDAWSATRVTVGTTEVEAKVGGSRLGNRQEVLIFNPSTGIVYVGPTGVTTSGVNGGIPLSPGEGINVPFGENIGVFLISDSASIPVIVWELA